MKQYHVLFTERAKKQLLKMDRYTAKMIYSWISKHLEGTEDPRTTGKALKGQFQGQWRYRIGEYRLIVQMEDQKLVILALNVGHRRDIYE